MTEVRLGWFKLSEGKYVADGLLILTEAYSSVLRLNGVTKDY